jgi:tetratricopeptide (TPR) repeat protein
MKHFFTLFIIVLISANSFSQIKSFRAEIPYQPEYSISDSIQSLTLLNRSATPKFKNYNEVDLQVEFYKKGFETDAIILDSLVADTTLKVMGNLLFESMRFDVVIPVYNTIIRTLPFNKTPEILSWNFVEEMCTLYNTDALLVLENQSIRTVTNYASGYNYDLLVPEKYHYTSMDFYSRTHWRMYYPKSKTVVLDLITNHDTLYWDNYSYDIVSLYSEIPSVKGAAIITGINNAFDIAEKITPQWKSEIRYYYLIRNKNIDKSVQHAAEGKWNEALENWLKYAETGRKIKRSKILHNIALAYEMTGNIDKAIEIETLSVKTYYRSVTNHYLKQLIKRKELLKKE